MTLLDFLLACFVPFFCLVPLFVPYGSLPAGALSRYIVAILRDVSSVQQLSGPLQHVHCSSSCSLSGLLGSHSSDIVLFFCSFLSYFYGLVCTVVLSYPVHASILPASLPSVISYGCLRFTCLTACDRRTCISRIKESARELGVLTSFGI